LNLMNESPLPVNRTDPVSRRAVLVALAAFSLTPAIAAPGAELSAPDALAQLKAGKLILVDIRTPEEWKQTGVAQGAVRLDMQHPKGAPGFTADLLKLTKGDKSAPVALICRTGNRTTQVQRYLEAQGFTQVINVREGMAGSTAGPGWLRRGLPLQ
jgi:rhodanese-related sulfurtransferase